MNHDSGALTTKLASTTAGMASNAWLANAGIIRIGTIPMPKATAFVVELPPGSLSATATRAYARAVLALARNASPAR